MISVELADNPSGSLRNLPVQTIPFVIFHQASERWLIKLCEHVGKLLMWSETCGE